MNFSEMEIGTRLELEVGHRSKGKRQTVLVSEFEWYTDENEAVIAAPIFEGTVYPLQIGTVMEVYFVKKMESDIQLFKFKASVTGREVSDNNLQLLRIEILGELEKIQRRNYYRLTCSVQVQYRVVDHLHDKYNENIPFKSTISNNISGGGISLMLEEKIEIGKIVECEIFTRQDKKVKFFGKVVRYERSDTESKFRFEAGIAYIKINDKDRESVVRFIFDEQRKQRKKGLI